MIAHASAALPVDRAAECAREIRHRIRSPAQECKAGHLLRDRHRAMLDRLLDEGGPVHGHAQVHLTGKAFFVADRMVDLLLGDTPVAHTLFGPGPGPTFGERAGGSTWRCRTSCCESGAPGNRRRRPSCGPPGTGAGRACAMPGARPAEHAGPERIAWVEGRAGQEGSGLAGVRLVHSRLDARVQIAGFPAGIARKIASGELGGCPDAARTARLRPCAGAESVWGDARSRSRLRPGVENPQGAAQINSGV
ncbi:hypothetical protein AQI88_09125 [Streptomyces cellostaticus]|uniref:Uncharacterized protein n=1 Tax=Streptomyces cellostaticus TaxID=67285 RepID=A0A101NPS3_9ACTN|nr:hypothetical protein AQI88_09125 [Streptomyces cellostaticus]